MEENKKQIDWKQVAWRVLQFFIIIFINSATIVWLVLHMIQIDVAINGVVVGQLNYWDAMSNDNIYNLIANLGTLEGLVGKITSWLPDYHWYNSMVVYLFMILGIVLTVFFVKFLYKNNKDKKKEAIENEKNEKWNKTFEKIFGKEKE